MKVFKTKRFKPDMEGRDFPSTPSDELPETVGCTAESTLGECG